MESTQKILIDSVELTAANKQAKRILAEFPTQDKALEDFVSLYTACTRKGLSQLEALEISSGITKNGNVPKDPGTDGFDKFLKLVESEPEKSGSYIAGLFDRVSSRNATIPLVVANGKQYSRGVVSRPKILGLDHQLEEIEKSVEYLFCFDGISNSYIDAMYEGMMLFGPPGTGKSSLCRYAIAHGQELSSRLGIPFRYTQFNPSDYSKWVGESAQNLKHKLDSISSLDGVGVLVIDDIDMVVQSRDDNSASHGFLQVTAELMQYLSGLEDSFVGNTLVLGTTNRIEEIDDGLMRRFEEIEVPSYSEKEHYEIHINDRMAWASEEQRNDFINHSFKQKYTPAVIDRKLKRLYREHVGRPALAK